MNIKFVIALSIVTTIGAFFFGKEYAELSTYQVAVEMTDIKGMGVKFKDRYNTFRKVCAQFEIAPGADVSNCECSIKKYYSNTQMQLDSLPTNNDKRLKPRKNTKATSPEEAKKNAAQSKKSMDILKETKIEATFEGDRNKALLLHELVEQLMPKHGFKPNEIATSMRTKHREFVITLRKDRHANRVIKLGSIDTDKGKLKYLVNTALESLAKLK